MPTVVAVGLAASVEDRSFSQVRAVTDSFGNGVQPASRGGMKEGEAPEEALRRELSEDLGPTVGEALFSEVDSSVYRDSETPKGVVRTCLVRSQLTQAWITENLVLDPSEVGQVLFLSKEEVKALRPIDRKAHKGGVPSDGHRYAFEDDRDAMLDAFG